MGIILVEINVQEQLIINAEAAMTLVPDIHQCLLPAAIVQKAMIPEQHNVEIRVILVAVVQEVHTIGMPTVPTRFLTERPAGMVTAITQTLLPPVPQLMKTFLSDFIAALLLIFQ